MAKDRGNNGFLSSIRRTFNRNTSASSSSIQMVAEEMRPLTKSKNSKISATTGANNANFEFSVRDHSDATAKRGFRVQVPKRIMCYTILVFLILPVVLFAYVEMHKHSLKKHAARYHSYDITKVLPHLLEDGILEVDEENEENENDTTGMTNTTTTTATTTDDLMEVGDDNKKQQDDSASDAIEEQEPSRTISNNNATISEEVEHTSSLLTEAPHRRHYLRP
jgi:hypothetical protein